VDAEHDDAAARVGERGDVRDEVALSPRAVEVVAVLELDLLVLDNASQAGEVFARQPADDLGGCLRSQLQRWFGLVAHVGLAFIDSCTRDEQPSGVPFRSVSVDQEPPLWGFHVEMT
jgi:hypothetical protein